MANLYDHPLAPHWKTDTTATDDTQLIRCVIKTDGFVESARACEEISQFLTKYSRDDEAFYTQLSVRGWQVEVFLTGINDTWRSESEAEVAKWIDTKYFK